jgi:hypothetical protein
MRAIDDDPLKYVTLKDRVYDRVTAEYSWDRVADQHDSFFKALFRDETDGFPRTIDTSIQQSDSR